MDGPRGDHEAGVDCSTDDTAQGVPRSFVKPIEKVVEAMFDHVRRRSIIEPVKLIREIKERWIWEVLC